MGTANLRLGETFLGSGGSRAHGRIGLDLGRRASAGRERLLVEKHDHGIACRHRDRGRLRRPARDAQSADAGRGAARRARPRKDRRGRRSAPRRRAISSICRRSSPISARPPTCGCASRPRSCSTRRQRLTPKSSPRKSPPTNSPICARSPCRSSKGPIGLENIRQDLTDRARRAIGRQGQRIHPPNPGGAMKRLVLVLVAGLALISTAQAQTVDLERADTQWRGVGDGARHADGRDTDGAFDRARPADHGHELHPLHRRAFISALRPGACRARRPISC